jgi:MOSC domain-containing protein YiiM
MTAEEPYVSPSFHRLARVTSVSSSPEHGFSKQPQKVIRLLEGLGVEGDSHCGTTVQHRSRVARDPDQPNLRQVHLVHTELFEEVAQTGHDVLPGELGENISTEGLDLLALPQGTVLRLGADAEVRVTGLRNPCRQIDDFQDGLLRHMVARRADGGWVRKAGVMAVVERSGEVRAGDHVIVVLPPEPHQSLDPV